MMDPRIEALTPWQRIVYQLCWSAGLCIEKSASNEGVELDRMKAERPEEFEAAFKVWTSIMYEVLY